MTHRDIRDKIIDAADEAMKVMHKRGLSPREGCAAFYIAIACLVVDEDDAMEGMRMAYRDVKARQRRS